MNILSFDVNKIKRDPRQLNLFNLFEKNTSLRRDLKLGIYVVPREFEMRLDRISNFLYGSPDYVEELMILNDIISPYSIKEGQIIYYCDTDSLEYLKTTDQMLKEEEKTKTIKTSTQNKSSGDITNLKQITITKDNRVQIINSFE